MSHPAAMVVGPACATDTVTVHRATPSTALTAMASRSRERTRQTEL